jgi:hypothetical protein
MEAVGQLDEPDRAELRAHIRGCERCHADRTALSEVVVALALADCAALDESVLLGPAPPRELRPASLDTAVLAMLSGPNSDSASSRRTHRRRQVWAGVAAAAVVIVVGTLALLHQETTGSRTVALRGAHGDSGTAILVPEAWGTSIQLTDHGEHASQILTVLMGTEYGRAWLAGSYRSVAAGEVRVTLACALPIERIGSISVTDSTGQVVLHS